MAESTERGDTDASGQGQLWSLAGHGEFYGRAPPVVTSG